VTELRQDPTTDDWVIIAHERAKRPYDYVMRREDTSSPAFVENCPFCPGNERLTPPEVAVYREGSGTSSWKIRVVPNKYPALGPHGTTEERVVEGRFRAMDGSGFHEVVIESPLHNQTLSRMSTSEIESIVRMYRDRYKVLGRERETKLIVIFKNHGIAAGTSIEHPHSQIVAAPVVSPQITKKCHVALEHYKKTGRCLYCDINEWELDSRTRLVTESGRFLVFHPYASRYPFETWVSPKRHNACFGNIDSEEIRELGKTLQWIMEKIDRALGKPDFNYVFHTAPVEDEISEHLHWYIQIVPRTWTLGGFEMGSGIYINTAVPEETAAFMRTI